VQVIEQFVNQLGQRLALEAIRDQVLERFFGDQIASSTAPGGDTAERRCLAGDYFAVRFPAACTIKRKISPVHR
jgi:hypothetical protein